MSKRGDTGGGSSPESQGWGSPLWGSRAVRCSVLGLLGSGVSRVDLFGAEVMHDHPIGVSCKRAAGKENDLGVPLREYKFLLENAPYQEPPQKLPTLTIKSSVATISVTYPNRG